MMQDPMKISINFVEKLLFINLNVSTDLALVATEILAFQIGT